MSYIIQKKQNLNDPTTVVISEGYTDLNQHPAILEHPELFEVVEGNQPDDITQFLNYQSS